MGQISVAFPVAISVYIILDAGFRQKIVSIFLCAAPNGRSTQRYKALINLTNPKTHDGIAHKVFNSPIKIRYSLFFVLLSSLMFSTIPLNSFASVL